MKKKRIMLCASYSAVEPLGVLHLAGLARDIHWDRKIYLTKDNCAEDLLYHIEQFKPDIIGFNIYTGNHLQTFFLISQIKNRYKKIIIVAGGPHPTYFPEETLQNNIDYVVMSEGFDSLGNILKGGQPKGIMPLVRLSVFPHPDRLTLYNDYPEFARSKVKSIITATGCPYQCTYCYNSSGGSKRLFPSNARAVEDVIKEGCQIAAEWDTDIIFFQDDVYGLDVANTFPVLSSLWKEKVGLAYHAQMRWEMVVGNSGKRRLDLAKEGGCTGLTLAVEAANHAIRNEMLGRSTPYKTMIDGMRAIKERGFKVRTEQITALPYGATKTETPVNLEADLSLIKLNLELKPDIAWASTFAPYIGTKLGTYSIKHGHYNKPDNFDVPDTFFECSTLKFPKKWIGPSLRKETQDAWLLDDDLLQYRKQNTTLRKHFNLLCLLPNGYEVAKTFLTKTNLTTESLCKIIGTDYFEPLPKSNLARERYKKYAADPSRKDTLSTAVRHHLYDEILYNID